MGQPSLFAFYGKAFDIAHLSEDTTGMTLNPEAS